MLSELKRQIKEGSIHGAFVLYGEESYLRNFYLSEVKKLFMDALPEFNMHELNARNMAAYDLGDAVESYPMMSGKKLVIVNNFTDDLLKEGENEFSGLIENLPEFTALFFVYDESVDPPVKSSKLKKFFEKAFMVEFKSASPKDLENWVMRHFKANKRVIYTTEIEYLLLRCGTSMTALSHEIEKISNFATSEKIEKKHIDAVTVPTIESRVYSLTDEIVRGRAQNAYVELHGLFETGFESVVVLAVISRLFSDLIETKAAIKKEGSADKAAKATGMAPWLMRKNAQIVRGFSHGQLLRALSLCLKADVDIKSSRIDQKIVLEVLIASLIDLKRERKNA